MPKAFIKENKKGLGKTNMALFGKKKDSRELRLPEAPLTFPELPPEFPEERITPLPKLPPLQQQESFRSFELAMPAMPSMPPARPQRLEKPLIPIAQLPQPMMLMPMRAREVPAPKMEMHAPSAKGPIFIKIDKYREAMANFELIKKKLGETSSLLDKIKDTRKSEEEELNAWAEELESIKAKIASIDTKVFSSLE